MQCLITGIGDAFTSQYFGSSMALRGSDGWVQLDCPDNPHRMLKEATEKATKNGHSVWQDYSFDTITDMVITHLHGDHCNGLESVGFYRWVKNLPPLRLWTHQLAADRLWEKLAPAMDRHNRQLSDFFDVKVFEPAVPFQIAGLHWQARFGDHPLPCVGFKITDNQRQVAWSGDTSFVREHIDWLNDNGKTDVLCHECNLGPHTRIESLEKLPENIRTKLALYHLPDCFGANDTQLRQLIQGECI